jgi:hypothetical protein
VTERPPRIPKTSRKAEVAFASDNAWFRNNPKRARLQRQIMPGELPRKLRNMGIIEVLIERAGSSRFARTWLDKQGRPVGSGFDFYEDEIVAGATEGAISIRQDGFCFPDSAGVCAIDRDWFHAHPDESSYTRPMLPAEIVTVSVPSGTQCRGGTVRVTRLDDRRRYREVVEMHIALIGTVQ